jgi:hypothetical protein
MGIRGRKPTSSQRKRITGNPGGRPIPAMPEFSPGDQLRPPRRWPMKGQERVEWARLVPDLQRCGIAKAIHQGLLEKVCELYAAGVVLYRKKDYAGARMQAVEFRKALAEFGGTPSSAGRVGFLGGSGAQADSEDEFFGPKLV